jgi:hypothetical protein
MPKIKTIQTKMNTKYFIFSSLFNFFYFEKHIHHPSFFFLSRVIRSNTKLKDEFHNYRNLVG